MKAEDITEALDDARLLLENMGQKVANIEVERDAILAYAVFLMVDSTEPVGVQVPEILRAIKRVLKFSEMPLSGLSAEGFGAGDAACLLNCRSVVKGLRQ